MSKAAALLESLVRNHPFVDGNKRGGGGDAAALFLEGNGRRLIATNANLEDFTFAVARGELTVAQMATWFEQESEVRHG